MCAAPTRDPTEWQIGALAKLRLRAYTSDRGRSGISGNVSTGVRVGLFSFPRLVHGGGFEQYLIAFGRSLTARGHDVSIVTASPRQYRALNIGLNLYYGNPLLHDNTRLSTAELRDQLGDVRLHEVPLPLMRRVLRRQDVIYAKNEVLDLLVLHSLRTSHLPPIVCGVHTPLWYPHAVSRQARLHNILYLSRAYSVLLAGTRAVHVANAFDEAHFLGTRGWPPDRIFRIPYPISVGDEPMGEAVGGGPLRVLWAARMTHQKGVETLLDIIAAINGSSDSAGYSFLIAGSGDPDIEERVRSTEQRHTNVRYLGYVPHDEMLRLYDDVDVALVTANWETLPYACLEPQSRGVPVVASDIHGCSDVVEHDVTGLLFPPGDVDAAVSTLRRLRDLRTRFPTQLGEMRSRAQRRIRERFDPGTVEDALERMLIVVARTDSTNPT
jgi:glycosyltransferase involved in cell wall biosynthesis